MRKIAAILAGAFMAIGLSGATASADTYSAGGCQPTYSGELSNGITVYFGCTTKVFTKLPLYTQTATVSVS